MESDVPKVPKQAESKRDAVIKQKNTISINFKTVKSEYEIKMKTKIRIKSATK